MGLEIEGPPIEATNTRFWPVYANDDEVGVITSAVYSPRLQRNIALAMVGVEQADRGTALRARRGSDDYPAKVVDLPFIDPQKRLAKSSPQ